VARPYNPELTKSWKVVLPATLAGTVELYLMDAIHKKPRYGSRAALLTALLSRWADWQKDPQPSASDVAVVERQLKEAAFNGNMPCHDLAQQIVRSLNEAHYA